LEDPEGLIGPDAIGLIVVFSVGISTGFFSVDLISGGLLSSSYSLDDDGVCSAGITSNGCFLYFINCIYELITDSRIEPISSDPLFGL